MDLSFPISPHRKARPQCLCIEERSACPSAFVIRKWLVRGKMWSLYQTVTSLTAPASRIISTYVKLRVSDGK